MASRTFCSGILKVTLCSPTGMLKEPPKSTPIPACASSFILAKTNSDPTAFVAVSNLAMSFSEITLYCPTTINPGTRRLLGTGQVTAIWGVWV